MIAVNGLKIARNVFLALYSIGMFDRLAGLTSQSHAQQTLIQCRVFKDVKMRLDHTLLPLKDYHKAKRLMWDPQEIDFTQDKHDWDAMGEREHALITRSIALFIGGEAAVTDDLSPLLVALKRSGGRIEEAMFLTTQLFEEAKHVEFFDRFIVKVLGEAPDAAQIAGPNYRALFGALNQALDTLLTDSGRPAQARAVASYHMIIEGVLAETGYYAIFKALREKDLMPGLTSGLELLQRDESRHIAFGLYLLTRLLRKMHCYGAWWRGS